eukprot:366230-Chlamydomonas_euryale.AAC.4
MATCAARSYSAAPTPRGRGDAPACICAVARAAQCRGRTRTCIEVVSYCAPFTSPPSPRPPPPALTAPQARRRAAHDHCYVDMPAVDGATRAVVSADR